MTPTIEDTVRAAGEKLGIRLSPVEVTTAAEQVMRIRQQAVDSGVPEFEAELIAQGFVLGYLSR